MRLFLIFVSFSLLAAADKENCVRLVNKILMKSFFEGNFPGDFLFGG